MPKVKDPFMESVEAQFGKAVDLLAPEEEGEEDQPWELIEDAGEAFFAINHARLVIGKLGEGAIYGYSDKFNPGTIAADRAGGDGFDFAVIRGRYVVDTWSVQYASMADRVIFDMKNKKDAALIEEMYGDMSKWEYFDTNKSEFVSQAEAPAEFRLSKPATKAHDSESPSP